MNVFGKYKDTKIIDIHIDYSVTFMWFGSPLYQKVSAGFVSVATLFGAQES